MRSLLRTMVAGFGVRNIYEAQDGADAIAIAIDRRPDIILCDWIMHPVDGFDFLRILRGDSDKQVASIPVIVISADARQSVVVKAVHAGVNHFLTKPLSPATLYERMVATITHPNFFPELNEQKKSTISARLEDHLKKLEQAKASGRIRSNQKEMLDRLVNPIISERSDIY